MFLTHQNELLKNIFYIYLWIREFYCFSYRKIDGLFIPFYPRGPFNHRKVGGWLLKNPENFLPIKKQTNKTFKKIHEIHCPYTYNRACNRNCNDITHINHLASVSFWAKALHILLLHFISQQAWESFYSRYHYLPHFTDAKLRLMAVMIC